MISPPSLPRTAAMVINSLSPCESHSTTPALLSNPLNRPENKIARNIQSMNMPYHTPESPRPNMYTKRYANPIRNTHMENTDTAMVNLASREALSAWGMVKARGHIIMAML